MQLVLLGNGNRQGVLETVEKLRPEIAHRAEILVEDFFGQADLSNIRADLAIVFGGDGSILHAVSQMNLNQIPVLAVRLGTLSFLSTIKADELITFLDRSRPNEMKIIEHLLLDCHVRRPDGDGPHRLVLNEVLVQGGTSSRLIGMELIIDGELVTTYSGDGLILSTPVGSTAHNLSAGGPILRKDIDAVVLSPISPHTLSNRPLVDSPNRHFEIRALKPAVLTLDGRDVEQLDSEDYVCVTRAEQSFKTVFVPNYSYYRTLRTKLGWNGSMILNGDE